MTARARDFVVLVWCGEPIQNTWKPQPQGEQPETQSPGLRTRISVVGHDALQDLDANLRTVWASHGLRVFGDKGRGNRKFRGLSSEIARQNMKLQLDSAAIVAVKLSMTEPGIARWNHQQGSCALWLAYVTPEHPTPNRAAHRLAHHTTPSLYEAKRNTAQHQRTHCRGECSIGKQTKADNTHRIEIEFDRTNLN